MAFGSINEIPLSARRSVNLRAQSSNTAGSLNLPSPVFFGGCGTSPEKSSRLLSIFFSSGNGVPSQMFRSSSLSSHGGPSSFPSSLTSSSSGPLPPGSLPPGGPDDRLGLGDIGGLVCVGGADVDLRGVVGKMDDDR